MHATTYGLDVAKRVFQMYWVDGDTGEIVNRRFGRDDLIQYLSRRPPGRVALEACGSAHCWARKIKALGHEVVLLHAKFIRPFVQTNKTDAADARAIWTAVQQPGMRTVAAKTEEKQAMLSVHRIRSLLVKFRTMQVNQLRGLMYEFGVSFRAGRVAGLAEVRARMADLDEALPGTMMCCLQDQLARIDGLRYRSRSAWTNSLRVVMLICLVTLFCPRRTIRRVANYVRQQVSTSSSSDAAMRGQGS